MPILRAQILGYDDAPIIQLAYLRGDTPYAFCITLADGPARTMTQTRREGLATSSWSDGTHDFLLIGGQGRHPWPRTRPISSTFSCDRRLIFPRRSLRLWQNEAREGRT